MNRSALLLAGTAAWLAAPAAAQVSDFRLQPAPTPTPGIIGPPAETPAPRPSPTPVPTTAAPTPTATATPRIVLPSVATPTPTPQPSARPPAPRTTEPAPAQVTPTAVPSAVPSALPSASATPVPSVLTPSTPPPNYTSAPTALQEEPAAPWWPWIVSALFLGAAGLAGAWWLRRRIGPVGALVVPEIERPRVPPPPQPAPESAAGTADAVPEAAPLPPTPADEAHPLHIAIELRKLTLTLMNATLGYRLTLTNTGPGPLEEIAVAADLIGAHAALPREVLLANPATELPMSHLVAGLAPGESADVTGEVRVPLAQLRPIAQGRARLFVPLARFRIGAQGQEPRCFTLVAGQPSPSGNGAIQPVRLDYGPRVYDGLAGRAF